MVMRCCGLDTKMRLMRSWHSALMAMAEGKLNLTFMMRCRDRAGAGTATRFFQRRLAQSGSATAGKQLARPVAAMW